MVSKLSGFQEYAGLWHGDAFPQRTTTSHMECMRQCVESLSEALKIYADEPSAINTKDVANEAGDVFVLLLSLAHKVGFDLMIAAADRIRVLQKQDKED